MSEAKLILNKLNETEVILTPELLKTILDKADILYDDYDLKHFREEHIEVYNEVFTYYSVAISTYFIMPYGDFISMCGHFVDELANSLGDGLEDYFDSKGVLNLITSDINRDLCYLGDIIKDINKLHNYNDIDSNFDAYMIPALIDIVDINGVEFVVFEEEKDRR